MARFSEAGRWISPREVSVGGKLLSQGLDPSGCRKWEEHTGGSR